MASSGGAVVSEGESRIFCEPFAGSAAVTYYLLGAKPPISYLGSKTGYAPTIAACLGLRRRPPAGIVLGEIGPMAAVHAVLGGAVGSASEVAGMAVVAGWSFRGGAGGATFDPSRAIPDPNGQRGALTLGGLSGRVEATTGHPRAAEVAAIIRGWAGEEPRPLWERLRREGWPSLMPVPGGRWLGPQSAEEVARWLHTLSLCVAKDGRMSGYSHVNGEGHDFVSRNGKQNHWTATTPEGNASRLDALPTFPPLAVWQGSADALALPADLSEWVIYLDPPYLGDGSRKITGYPHGSCDRATVLRLAREWSERGAVVGISECIGLAGEMGAGWHEVDITHGRRGQKRTFTKNQGSGPMAEEWLTMNRPPQHIPHRGQVGLFMEVC